MIRPPATSEPARRISCEDRMVDLLMHLCWPIEHRGPARASAEAEARAALGRLVSLGLPHALHGGERRFDPVEVANFVVWAGRAHGDPVFQEHYVASPRRLLWEQRGVPNGAPAVLPPPPATLGEGRYRVTLRRTFGLSGQAPGKRLRLRLPLPIEDEALRDLAIEPLVDGAAEISKARGRLDVIAAAPHGETITAGWRATFTALPRPAADAPLALDPDERELYTRPTDGLIRITPRIAALAVELAGDSADAAAAMARFWQFMLDEMASGYVHYDRLDPVAPLDSLLDLGWFDCRLGSALLAALCRVRGIPARLVSGYLLFVSSPGIHAWLEVWIEGSGWRSYDLFGWKLGEGWRGYLYGQLDHRMVLERPPLLFAGAGAIRLPPAWDMLNYAEGAGSVTEFRRAFSGELVYSEYAEIERV